MLGHRRVAARSERVALQLRIERIAGRVVRHRDQIPEVDAEMIVGKAELVPHWPDPSAGKRGARDLGEALDAIARVEILVTDPIDVHRRGPAVRRCVSRELVSRRTVAAICRDAYWLTDSVAKMLEHQRAECHRARYITREKAEGHRFSHIRVYEFPQMKVGRELVVEGCIPRLDLEEEARQLTSAALAVAQHTAGH